VVSGKQAIVPLTLAAFATSACGVVDRVRQVHTMSDMRQISYAAAAFASEYGRYPTPAEFPTLMKYNPDVSLKDPWGRPYRYTCWATRPVTTDCDAYIIASAGSDGIFEHQDLKEYLRGGLRATTSFSGDIVFSDGVFVLYPEGRER
jgi:hypothetical protein